MHLESARQWFIERDREGGRGREGERVYIYIYIYIVERHVGLDNQE
jgi:hypothetical protein